MACSKTDKYCIMIFTITGKSSVYDIVRAAIDNLTARQPSLTLAPLYLIYFLSDVFIGSRPT